MTREVRRKKIGVEHGIRATKYLIEILRSVGHDTKGNWHVTISCLIEHCEAQLVENHR